MSSRVVARPTVARDARRARAGRDGWATKAADGVDDGAGTNRGRTRARRGRARDRRDARRTRAEVLHGRRQGRGREDVAVELARGEVRERGAQDAGGEHGPRRTSLSDSLAQNVRGGQPVEVNDTDGMLYALEIDPESAKAEFTQFARGDGHERGGRETL